MVILLILIPFFSIGLVLYITNLFEFVTTGNFNELLFIISTIITVASSYIITNKFVDLIKSNKIDFLNKKNKYLIIGNYFSVFLLILLGVALLYQGILHLNVAQIMFGIGSVFIFIYITYMYFFYFDENEFVLKTIMEYESHQELHFEYEDVRIVYYTNDTKYKVNQKYIINYNKYTSVIKKINGLVLGGDEYEKNNKEKYKKEKTSRV